MKLFTIHNEKLKSISSSDFKLEKDIQNLVENNLEELFHLYVVKSELTIKNFRVDTLCFDKENNSFVVIEYKKDRNFSVIDQGYTYMSLHLNNVTRISHRKSAQGAYCLYQRNYEFLDMWAYCGETTYKMKTQTSNI